MSISFVETDPADYPYPDDFEDGDKDEEYIEAVEKAEETYFYAQCLWCRETLNFKQFDQPSIEDYNGVMKRLEERWDWRIEKAGTWNAQTQRESVDSQLIHTQCRNALIAESNED